MSRRDFDESGSRTLEEVRYCGAGGYLNCGVRQCLVFRHSGQVGVSISLVKGERRVNEVDGSVSCRVKDSTNLYWKYGNGGWSGK